MSTFLLHPNIGNRLWIFPQVISKVGNNMGTFPKSYSLYRGIIGTCESQYRGITGTCKSQYTGVIDTRKIHQRVIIGQIPLRGNFWDMENPLWGEIMWNSCPKIDFGRQFWYFFPKPTLFTDCELQKIFCDGRVPCHFFLQESGKIYFFISWKLCIITVAGLLNLLLISCLRRFKNRKTLDNNDLNQVGVQRF